MSRQVLVVLREGQPAVADPGLPLLHADDLAVLRGEGVFETMRVTAVGREGGRPLLPEAHLDRLARSAAAVDLVVPARAALAELVATAAAAWPAAAGDGLLRLVVTKGPAPGSEGAGVAYALVSAIPAASVAARRDGVHAVTLTLGVAAGVRPAAPWLLGGAKATSYAVPMAALREAAARGADDALWVSADGEVLEGATSSVAWVGVDGTLVTPPPEEVGILPGTTLAAVVGLAEARGMRVQVRRAALGELVAAREALLLGSVKGVVPLLSLDGAPLGDGRPGPATCELRDAFEAEIAGAAASP